MKPSCGCGCLTTMVASIVLALALYSAHPWLLRQWGYSLLHSDPLQKADAIVVLSGGYPVRSREAAALYQEGWSPLVVLTREVPPEGFYELKGRGVSLPETIDINQQVLEGLGVPRLSISRIETPTDNTDEEVQRLRNFLQQRKVRRVILVTAKTHSRRSCLVFDHYFNKDIQVVCRYSRFDSFDPAAWWKARRYTREFIFEWQKLVLYRLQFALNSILGVQLRLSAALRSG